MLLANRFNQRPWQVLLQWGGALKIPNTNRPMPRIAQSKFIAHFFREAVQVTNIRSKPRRIQRAMNLD